MNKDVVVHTSASADSAARHIYSRYSTTGLSFSGVIQKLQLVGHSTVQIFYFFNKNYLERTAYIFAKTQVCQHSMPGISSRVGVTNYKTPDGSFVIKNWRQMSSMILTLLTLPKIELPLGLLVNGPLPSVSQCLKHDCSMYNTYPHSFNWKKRYVSLSLHLRFFLSKICLIS